MECGFYRIIIEVLQSVKFLDEAFGQSLRARLAVDVAHLLRILLQVVKFPLVNVVVEMHQAVA